MNRRLSGKNENEVFPPMVKSQAPARNAIPSNPTNSHKNYEKMIARWTAILGVSTIILAFATFISAYFLWKTDLSVSQQVVASHIQLRAYVAKSQLVIAYVNPNLSLLNAHAPNSATPEDNAANISLSWRNFGLTPAIEVDTWTSVQWFPPGAEPDFSKSIQIPSNSVVDTLSAGQESFQTPVGIPTDFVKKLGEKRGNVFFWGQAKYKDVFSDNDIHVFHFCLINTGPDLIEFQNYKSSCNYSY